jgi:hypothetical protein
VPGLLEEPRPAGGRRLQRPGRLRLAVLAFVGLGLGLGAAGGVAWWQLVDLPVYTLADTGQASTSERGLAGFVAGDAWFCAVGAAVGLLLGIIAWRRFRDIGWSVVLLGTLTAVASALIAWEVGLHLGPQNFDHRLAAAGPGDRVPIDLTLRTRASLLIWPFFAVIPILLGSSLGRDDEDPSPVLRPAVRDSS